jgi:pimeloyl-ACP methyl ester carboxylesterase
MPRALTPPSAPSAPWHARRADEDYGKGADPDWRQVDWAAHLHQAEIAGGRVNYVDIGSGDEPPMVLVHGLGGQWQNWLENIPRLAQERRVIAPDLPGFGLSEMPSDRISISGYGQMVDALIEHLEIERADVVGNSMGGFVSSEVAVQFPHRVERLALVSAAGISSASVSRTPVLAVGRIATALTAYTAARHRAMARRPLTRHLALAFVARHPSKFRSDLAWEGFIKGAGKEGFDDALRACVEYDFRDRLPEIQAPTLIVWGEKDSVIPTKDAEEFERLIPDSRKVVMEDTGHVPMAERPAAFNDLLLDFLADTSVPSREEPAAA